MDDPKLGDTDQAEVTTNYPGLALEKKKRDRRNNSYADA